MSDSTFWLLVGALLMLGYWYGVKMMRAHLATLNEGRQYKDTFSDWCLDEVWPVFAAVFGGIGALAGAVMVLVGFYGLVVVP